MPRGRPDDARAETLPGAGVGGGEIGFQQRIVFVLQDVHLTQRIGDFGRMDEEPLVVGDDPAQGQGENRPQRDKAQPHAQAERTPGLGGEADQCARRIGEQRHIGHERPVRHDLLVDEGLHAIEQEDADALIAEESAGLVAVGGQRGPSTAAQGGEEDGGGQADLGFHQADDVPRVGIDHHAVDDMELDRRPVMCSVIDERRQQACEAERADDIDAGPGPKPAALAADAQIGDGGQAGHEKAIVDEDAGHRRHPGP